MEKYHITTSVVELPSSRRKDKNNNKMRIYKIMDNTKRFSNKVENYVRYRPSYPTGVIKYLVDTVGINSKSTVADIASGTGMLSQLLINRVKKLYCVEPNNEMRQYSEGILKKYNNCSVINGSAETTNLEDNSVDFITVAQAFHWFNTQNSINEFKRILKPSGIMILIWNNRVNNTEFLKVYDDSLKKYAIDYNELNHQNITDNELNKYFKNEMIKKTFNNYQEFDIEGVMGRVLSCSYAPPEESENFKKLKKSLKESFNKNAVDSIIHFNYETELFWGIPC